MSLIKKGDTFVYHDARGDEVGAEVVVALAVDAAGNQASGLPPGRAAASASVPTVLSNEDFARISQTYRRAAAVAAGGGDAVLVSGVTTAGPVTLTLVNGGSAVVSVPVGSTVLPFSATAAAMGSTGGTAQNLFFT
jgi:hypothetical protein